MLSLFLASKDSPFQKTARFERFPVSKESPFQKISRFARNDKRGAIRFAVTRTPVNDYGIILRLPMVRHAGVERLPLWDANIPPDGAGLAASQALGLIGREIFPAHLGGLANGAFGTA